MRTWNVSTHAAIGFALLASMYAAIVSLCNVLFALYMLQLCSALVSQEE
jgi:hypothetical protein